LYDNVVAPYCITADLLKAIGHQDDQRRELTDAEVITTAFASALYFGGNLEHSRTFMKQSGFMPRTLSKSRLCRRLHKVDELAVSLFHQLGWLFKCRTSRPFWIADAYEKIGSMKEPIFVRSLTSSERATLRAALRSPQAFTLRRSQTLLLSADGKTPRQIARQLGCTDQTQ
jgi:hypothetical protein